MHNTAELNIQNVREYHLSILHVNVQNYRLLAEPQMYLYSTQNQNRPTMIRIRRRLSRRRLALHRGGNTYYGYEMVFVKLIKLFPQFCQCASDHHYYLSTK